MKGFRKILGVIARVLICLALLAWIFQAIFWDEGKRAWEQSNNKPAWQELTRLERLNISWTYGPPELWKSLTAINRSSFVASVLLVGGTVLAGICRWRLVLLAQGFKIPFLRIIEISLVAQFFNAFLLGSTGGDLIKAYYVARETHHRKTEAVTTVFADRLIGLFSMLFLAVIMMIPNYSLITSSASIKVASYLVIAMFIASCILSFLAFWGGVSKHFPGARALIRKLPKGEIFERSIDSCRELGKCWGLILGSLGISMLLNIVCVLQFYVIARGMGINVSPLVLFGVVPMIISISALPVTPSGLGVRENLFVLMLSAPGVGIGPTNALSISLLAYLGSLIWSLVGGCVYLLFREKHHLREIANIQDEAQGA